MAEKRCSCGACVRVANVPPHHGEVWLWDGGYNAVACPECGDHLLPGGDNIPAAELRAAHEAMQAMLDGRCTILTRGHRFGADGQTVEFHAYWEYDQARGDTPEAAVAALLAKGDGHD